MSDDPVRRETAAGATAAFEAHRRLLFGVAYDMLGSVADAEDCVQETWIRWARADRSNIREPRGYLVRVVANVALDRLRDARARRESYVGPWLPEPLLTAPDAAERVERAEAVSYALLVVLETLGPVERAVFVLREVFGLPYAEIAEILGRSAAGVRQVAHRAREHVRARRPRFSADPAGQRRLTERFLAACRDGDVAGLTELLAEDVVVVTDGGGRARAALRPVAGLDRAVRFLAGLGAMYAGARAEVASLNGGPGLVLYPGGAPAVSGVPLAAAVVEAAGGRITRVLVVRNPDKLHMLRHVPSGTAPVPRDAPGGSTTPLT
ncbi:RNA polymerase sigma-70 factor [Marinitenerispora sediminis]|uniref:RNA polymerase sigma-70 factor n=1 Tax=Marinitenerispora sediminis TaxID=1931232 RepID=UPI0018F18A4A|nr:RNA polymerase sigma-70 factor [Marinitenerispora sediminis]